VPSSLWEWQYPLPSVACGSPPVALVSILGDGYALLFGDNDGCDPHFATEA